MPLPALVVDINSVSESVREFYTKTDDGYVLDVDNGGYQQKLGEFRNNNIQWKKDKEQLQEQLKKYSGIDPEKHAEMQKTLETLEEKGLLESGKIDELVEKRANKFRQEYEDQIGKLTTAQEAAENQARTYKTQLDDLAVGNLIAKAVSDVGRVQQGALTDILARAKTVWRVNENGVPVAMDGDTVLYGKDGKQPLTAEEWAQELRQTASYLFEGNSGGGASGSGSNPPRNVQKISREEFATGKYIDAVAKGEVEVAE